MSMHRAGLRIAAVLSLVFVFTGLARGQEPQSKGITSLIDQLPPGTFAFIGTAGGDKLKSAFDQSPYGRICQEQSVREFVQAIKTELSKGLSKTAEDERLRRLSLSQRLPTWANSF